MTIRFGDELFYGPFAIGEWNASAIAGVYCIVVPDSRCTSSYRAIYIGESYNFAERGFPRPEDGDATWLAIANYKEPILIAAHWMPESTVEQRKTVQQKLIRSYLPECNVAVSDRPLLTH